MMDFRMSEEHQMLRQMVRDFAGKEIALRAEEIDATEKIPAEIFRRMSELGLSAITFPYKSGGSGGDYIGQIIALEEIARASGSVALFLDAHTSLCCEPIYLFGSEAEKQKYLPPLAGGEKIGAFGLTEPQAGSDAAAIRTRAVRAGGEWVINGQKIFITNGSLADVLVIAAKTNLDEGKHGISSVIGAKGMPGLRVGRDEKKMGLKGSVTSELFFENCRIPAENLLGKENEGYAQFLTTLDAGRIAIAAMALGLAQGAFDKTVAYAKGRVQFDQPIARFQAIQGMIADMATDIEAARLLVNQAAWLKTQGQPFSTQACMAKLFASEVSERGCYKAIQIHGGGGDIFHGDV